MATQELNEPRSNRLLICLIVLIVWMALILGGRNVFFPNINNLDDLVRTQINTTFVIASVFLLAVIFYFRWQQRAGLKPAEPPNSWRLLWLPMLFITLFLLFSTLLGLPPTSAILFVLINSLLVGVEEELMFRGIIFQGFLPRLTIWQAIVVTSLLFGAIHIFNGFINGNFAQAIIQAGAAALSGLWLMAIRLRSKSIYPAMLAHGLWDFSVFVLSQSIRGQNTVPTGEGVAAQPFLVQLAFTLLLPLPLFLYGLWLLRGIGTQTKEAILA